MTAEKKPMPRRSRASTPRAIAPRRVMMLVHYTLVPPDDLTAPDDPRMENVRTEFDVKQALLALGHDVRVVGVYDDLAPVRQCIEEWKPEVAFNLIEDFAGVSAFDYYMVSYLAMMKIPYTGCNPRGLVLARDKALSKKLLAFHRISVPEFTEFPLGRVVRPARKMQYPVIVKSMTEEGSVGIAQASFVENGDQLRERVALIHEKFKGDAIAEQYINGRELYVTVVGNTQLKVLPIRELAFKETPEDRPKLATYKVKWDPKYRERWGIDNPLEMYLADIFTVPANIAGNPAISIPSGFEDSMGFKLPLGIQFVAPHFHEDILFTVGKKFLGEDQHGFHSRK